MDARSDGSHKIDLVYGGAYSIKSYYMESDNPRQMRGASQLLIDAIASPQSGLTLQHDKFGIWSIEDELRELGGKLLHVVGSTFLASVPPGKGKEAAELCEQRYYELTLIARFATVYISDVDETNLDDAAIFSSKIHPTLLSKCEERRYLLIHSTGMHHSVETDELIHPQNGSYIHPANFLDQQRCSRCNLRDAYYYGELFSEGRFSLCPSCAHKEYRGGFIQRNHFRDECAEYAQTIGLNIVTPNDVFNNNNEIPIWFGTTNDYADASGDVALLYADINNLGGAVEKLKPYSQKRYKEFGTDVETTIKKSLYHSLTMAVIQAYDDGRVKYPDHYDKERGYPACFEIVSVGGDDICVLMPGTIALTTATMLLDEFNRRWRAGCESKYGFLLSLSVGTAVGQSTTPGQFMLDSAEQLLKIAKNRSHKEGARSRGALDILNLNSDAQWATSVEYMLRGKLTKEENGSTAVLTLRPFSLSESETVLQILGNMSEYISLTMLRSLSDAAEKLAIVEAGLYAQYLWSKQNTTDRSRLELLYGMIHKAISGSLPVGKRFDMFIPVGEKLVAPWRDLMELRGQMGKRVIV